MKKNPYLTVLLLAFTPLSAPAQEKETPEKEPPARTEPTPDGSGRQAGRTVHGKPDAPVPVNEADFILSAAKGGKNELKLAELGVSKAENEKVKALAEMLVKDHTKTNSELKAVAENQKVTLPDLPDPEADRKHRELASKNGGAFDRAFLAEMGVCHDKAIALFEAGKRVAKSGDVEKFIDKTLPVLTAHHQKIQSLSGGPKPEEETKTLPAPTPGNKPPGTVPEQPRR